MREETVDLISAFERADVLETSRGGSFVASRAGGAGEDLGGEIRPFVALIEDRLFLRECIRNSVGARLGFPVRAYTTVEELARDSREADPQVVMLSMNHGGAEACVNALKILSESLPNVPVIVLAYNDDPQLTRLSIRHGAKGYIPFTLGFDVVVGAVRLILAGGTYVPVHLLLENASNAVDTKEPQPAAAGAPTTRELAVIRAIQKGLSNKIIAYDLNMCESTVKVHVRNIMKKMKAKNRTDIAIKAQSAWASSSQQAAAL